MALSNLLLVSLHHAVQPSAAVYLGLAHAVLDLRRHANVFLFITWYLELLLNIYFVGFQMLLSLEP